MRSEENIFFAIGKFSAKEHHIGGSSHRVSIEAFLLKRIKDLGENLSPTSNRRAFLGCSGAPASYSLNIFKWSPLAVSSQPAYTSPKDGCERFFSGQRPDRDL